MAIFSDSVDGDDQAFFGGSRPGYALWHVTNVGTSASVPDLATPDLVLRLGWIAFFYRATLPDLSTRDYYDEPIWLNFLDGRWHPEPATTADGNNLLIYADGIRWHLLGGAVIDLEIGP